jgi:hypothetical protein
VSRISNKTLRYLVGGLLLVGSLAYLANQPDDRVQKVCREAQIGSSIADLNRYANEVGISSQIVPTGTTSLVAGKTHGSYRCEIEAIDGVVRDVKFENDSD